MSTDGPWPGDVAATSTPDAAAGGDTSRDASADLPPDARDMIDGEAVDAEAGDAGTLIGAGTIDTHVHFWDPAEQRGLLYPAGATTAALPADHQRSARGADVAAVVLVESVWRPEDHDWAFRLADRTPYVHAIVGKPSDGRGAYDLRPEVLDRLRRHPRFRGVRVGGELLGRADARRFFAAVAERGLSLEVQSGDVAALDALARDLPRLRIVTSTQASGFAGREPPAAWKDAMRRLGARPNVFVKTISLLDAQGAADVDRYRPLLDHLMATVGEDRLMFGTNWPVSANRASVAAFHALLFRFLDGRGALVRDKVLRRNALAFYGA
jgi:L-fuconolactonase